MTIAQVELVLATMCSFDTKHNVTDVKVQQYTVQLIFLYTNIFTDLQKMDNVFFHTWSVYRNDRGPCGNIKACKKIVLQNMSPLHQFRSRKATLFAVFI